jgi:predicted  nucleic acid-binding Zn-ribbon protein
MITELENLVALQKRDLEIAAIESRLRKIPVQIAELQHEVALERSNAKTGEERLQECQKSRRALEGELELIEGRIKKYKEQLMQVKSNEEYRAMQKQIQSAKEEVSAHEDMILAKLEEGDRLQEELRVRQRQLKEGLEHVSKLETELESEATRLRAELDQRSTERNELEKILPKDLFELYQKIARTRARIAVAEAKDEHCQECHVRLRPQVYSELRMGNKILRCDNCSRILYFTESNQ